MTKEERLLKFVEDNKIDLSEEGSAENANHCVLAGYALYIGFSSALEVSEVLQLNTDSDKRFWVVFNFAKSKHYETPWFKGEYKSQYVYDELPSL